MKYIAYGSNMSVSQMARRCPGATLLGTGKLYYATLEFFTHATVERSPTKRNYVPVAVWDITKADESSLDRYEGVPHYYIKERWKVRMDDGSTLTGMMYRMNRKHGGVPFASYFAGIRDAYKDLGLGSEIKKVLMPALARSLDNARLG